MHQIQLMYGPQRSGLDHLDTILVLLGFSTIKEKNSYLLSTDQFLVIQTFVNKVCCCFCSRSYIPFGM